LAMITSSCAPQTESSTEPKSIVLTDCVLSSPAGQNQVDAKCGSLTVLEDPSNPQSRKIDLNIAVGPGSHRGVPRPLQHLISNS
jgi:hypothetical protein